MNLRAPAKVNLYLKVVGKRPDGYHELLTLMMPIRLFDEIVLEKADTGISVRAPGCGCNERNNLAFKAAELFLKETGVRAGVSIRISKRIPPGAGLGGGSSDASSVIMGMNELFKTGLSRTELMKMAGKIGADCPFFFLGRPYLMGGRGDVPLHEVTLEPRSYFIVTPPLEISTAKVYSHLKCPLTRERKSYKIINEVAKKGIAPEQWLENDLEKPAFGICPELERVRSELLDAGALGVIMSGSGSSVLGIFQNEEHLCSGMSRIRRHEGYRYVPTTSLTGGSHGDYRGKGVSGQG